jgi:DNA-binding transcriptional MerR regulator
MVSRLHYIFVAQNGGKSLAAIERYLKIPFQRNLHTATTLRRSQQLTAVVVDLQLATKRRLRSLIKQKETNKENTQAIDRDPIHVLAPLIFFGP